MKVLHKRSTSGKLPTSTTLDYGEIAVNYSNADPFLSIRKEDGSYVRISSDEKWNEAVANVDKKFDDYLPLSGGTMKATSLISWGNANNDLDTIGEWNFTTDGLRIMTSTRTGTHAPTQYCTGLHVQGRYGFQIAAEGGNYSNFFNTNLLN